MSVRETKRTGSAFNTGDNVTPIPSEILAIDPGTKHCGMAHLKYLGSWFLHDTYDLPPNRCCGFVEGWIKTMDEQGHGAALVVEGFRLYPNKMQEQGMSKMGTPEVIGGLKWAFIRSASPLVRFIEQGASIKPAGRRFMANMGILETGSNTHKRDAEAHAWYQVKVIEAERKKFLRGT